MKVLFAASEVAPLIKTGGLADVAGSLPASLHALGVDVRLVLPAYPEAVAKLAQAREVTTLSVGPDGTPVHLLAAHMGDANLPVYLVDHSASFDRAGNPYVAPGGSDWADNADRFALFCRVITEMGMGRAGLDWQPDVVHCNDWQTGLAPALLYHEGKNRPRTLFTIHNLSYQGFFSNEVYSHLKLPWDLWHFEGLEFHGGFSFIKGGIAYSDCISTVSPTYATEILSGKGGYGLEGLLIKRRDRLIGIVNGVDYQTWNPAEDPLITQRYDASTFELKARNKTALQRRLGLEAGDDSLLFGHIGRMVHQKGVDLILDMLPQLMAGKNAQLAILGSGDAGLETRVKEAARRYPGRVGASIGYDESLSHLIEAGCDAFLMPSRFEPCGLNQMYSLRYGTVPIVHRVGGLADTVVDATPANMLTGKATGFTFEHADVQALWYAVQKA
ncbi:MAG: glycogen synthase GlgA, partial [Pseudomonadota bacterium]